MLFKRKQVASALALLLGIGSAAFTVAPAFAQDVRVEVTGSRIRALGADSPSPLQVITSEEIAASGVTNLQELLLKNPTMGTPTISRTNSNFLTTSVGVATVDLRNLGTARTLVLVNGRRFVAGIPGESAVDLNTIPVDFIERVELLTGGASSVYGSDAVAGVVNIILKRDFEGVLLDYSYGQSEENDDKTHKVSLTFGTTGAGGKANLMGHLSFTEQGAVLSRDREATAIDQASRGAFITGEPADFFTIQRPFFSSFAPQGRVFPRLGTAGNRTFDAQGNLIPFSTNGPAGDGVGATGFNRSDFRSIAVPTKRFLFAAKGDYALTDNHTAFFEGNYASTQTKSVLEPFPLDSGGGNGIYPATGGRVPAEFLVGGVVRRNPIISDAIFNILTDTNGDGIRDYGFTRRLSEIGNRGNVADRDTYRFATGLKGSVAKTWDYDTYVAYGQTRESQTSSGQVNVLNFRNALEAIPDVNDIDGDGNRAEAICRDADARRQGCVPINVFGFNSISPGAAQYVRAPKSLTTLTSQKLLGATITGEPYTLPAGPLGIAAGVEYREEFSRSEFDALTQAGLNAGNAAPRTEGRFDVTELFVEARVPLLKDLPFAKALTFTGAVRGGDYSTVGNTISWNAGLEWAPIADLRFRGTRALSTRAPNINELFQPPSQDFPTGLIDPCLGVTATSSQPAAARCRADAGVAANIAANGVFTQTQADQQGISGFDSGNPNLKEEEGKSYTLGLVYTPTTVPWLQNFAFTADYFNIKIKDAIVGLPNQFALDQCYTGDASFCQFITRRQGPVGANSAGSLEFVNQPQFNSGDLVAEGVDLTVSYFNQVGPGRLSGRLAYTYLLKGYLIPVPGAERDEFRGEIGAPKHKASLTLGYTWGPWGITSQTTYLGKSALDDQFLKGFDLPAGSFGVGSKTYQDFQFTYTYRKTQFYVGIDNAFDTKAPPIITGLPGNNTGTETDAGTYDPIGRRYYAGVRIGF